MSAQAQQAAKQVNALKVPPHSIEAEQSVLGALMIDPQAWDRICDQISEADFYRREHQILYRQLYELAEKSKPQDVLTLVENLKAHNALAQVGGEDYLYELAKNTPSAANIKAYAEIVRERSVLRQLIEVANEIATQAYHPGSMDSVQMLDDAEKRVFAIAEQSARTGGPINIKTVLANTIDRIDTLYNKKESITGIATGFNDFDMMTSGLQAADLVIIAGRPSMGKTTFAMNIGEHAALKNSKPVVVFSLEMPAESLVTRMLSSLGQIDQHRLRTGNLSDDDWSRINSGMALLSQTSLFIDDTAALSPAEIRARARRIAKEQGQLGLIIIDYLQLMQVPGFSENRTLEVSEISRSLKALAKELKVPVIALSQLNRGLESRSDKRPLMSDLRESGAIEQDADLIVFIYRDEVYNEDSPDKGTAEILIAKQRNGPIGKVRLTFRGQFTRFDNFTQDNFSNHFE